MKKVTLYLLVLIISISFNSYLFSQETTKSDKSLGSFWYTEYWFSVPPCLEYADDEDNEIIIYVVAENDEEITVEIPGKGYKETKSAEAYKVCTFTLSPSLGQCYRRKANETVPPDSFFSGYGIHIYGEAPIIASCFINYEHAAEAINIMPMTILGREYVVSGYNDNNSGSGEYYPAECAIVAIYDKTKATFILGGNDSTSTTGGLLPDSIKSKTLNAGDVWLFSSAGENADLSGSKIMSTKPVSVISGNYAATIPGTGEPLNYIADMLIPQYTGGKIFYIPNIPGRKNPPLIRVYARKENTTVYRNGEMVGFLEDAGGLISKAYLEMRLNEEDAENQYACISADKPITVSMFNPGYQDDENGFSNNSPFMMNMIPLIQFENEKTFVIPDFGGETEHYLNFVFEMDGNGGIAGSVILGKYEEDDFAWVYISDIAGEVYGFEYENEGKNFAFKNIKIETPGVYKLRADVPFALYAYGHYNEKSYGYPVIGSLGEYSRPDTVAPEIHADWGSDGKGCGYAMDMPDNDTVRVNMASVHLEDKKNNNFILYVSDFEVGMDRETDFAFNPRSIFEDADADIIATDRNGNESSKHIWFNRKEFYLIPDVLDFGLLDSGETKTMEIKIINRSVEKVIVPSRFHLLSDMIDTLDNQGFILEHISLPDTLESTDTIYAECTFTAEKTGIYTDSVGIGDTTAFGYITYLKAIVSGPGGINDNEDMAALSVYPNPADGEVNIILPDSDGIINNIEIYTIEGRKIYSEEYPVYNDNKIRVNTSAFPEGHYNIEVNTGKREYTYALMILH